MQESSDFNFLTSPLHEHCFSADVDYVYTAPCPQTGEMWQLLRTPEVEAIARKFIQENLTHNPEALQTSSLYGVLLVETAQGEQKVLVGCSGSLNSPINGQGFEWVPPVTDQVRIVLMEPYVLAKLDQLKAKLIALSQLLERTLYEQQKQQYEERLTQLKDSLRRRKEERDRKRTDYSKTLKGDILTKALHNLKRESQQDKHQLRCLKQERDKTLTPLMVAISQSDQHIKDLKKQYITLSKQWQSQLQVAYAAAILGKAPCLELESITQYLNVSLSEQVCQRASAKLLHFAAKHHLKPLAMAEFWWRASQEKLQLGEFYDVSPEECQLLMQIATMPSQKADYEAIPILYQDDAIIVVDKPAGILSVPGRRYHLQDSVLSRLRLKLSPNVQIVHRLDQATSGLMVLALSTDVHKSLSQQFAQQQVYKTYEAILSRAVTIREGTISLPLWNNPAERPMRSVHRLYGKPSVTYFQVIQPGENPRVMFTPKTGRTHQLRVHAAHAQGLNSPILGDNLYGHSHSGLRLHLHASSLQFMHPLSKEQLQFDSSAPF